MRIRILAGLAVALGAWLVFHRHAAPLANVHPTTCTAVQVIGKYHCTYCHVTDCDDRERMDNPRRNCAHCHYHEEKGVITVFLAPDIDAIGRKLRPDWIRAYLEHPFPVHPHHRNTMPAFDYAPGEVDALVRHFSDAAASVKPDCHPERLVRETDLSDHEARLTRGRELTQEYSCFDCHEFSGVVEAITRPVNADSPCLKDVAFFAPDLRFTRERMRPLDIAGYILDPQQYDTKAFMPYLFGITPEQAEDIAYYLLYSDLPPPPCHVLDTTRIVQDPDYNRDIIPLLFKYCFSCHFELRDNIMAWPTGRNGGFAEHYDLDVSTPLLFMKGAKHADGKFHPVIEPGNRDCLLLLHLRGERYPRMPLGLKLDPEDYQIFENWVMRGARIPPPEKQLELSIEPQCK